MAFPFVPPTVLAPMEGLTTPALRALLAKVSCPVLLVHGDPERGGIVPGSAAERCAAACRGGCDVLALPAGHNPRREARDAFVTAVAETLRRYRD